MIRIVWIAALSCVLALVLYIPSAVPPDRLMQTVRSEHELNTTLWGMAAADRILERMLTFQAGGMNVSSPPPETVQVAGPGINTAMAVEFGQMSTRLFSSPYFKSVDALFTLAALRAATLLHVLHCFWFSCSCAPSTGSRYAACGPASSQLTAPRSTPQVPRPASRCCHSCWSPCSCTAESPMAATTSTGYSYSCWLDSRHDCCHRQPRHPRRA